MLEISLKELLPNTFKAVDIESRPFWDVKGSVDNRDFLNSCIREFRSLHQKCCAQKNYLWANEVMKMAVIELVEVKEQEKNERISYTLDLFQFSMTLAPLNALVGVKDLLDSYNWIVYGLCDDLSDEQQKSVALGRLFGFASDYGGDFLLTSCSIDNWIGNFYYVCRCLSAMPSIAEALFDFTYCISIKSLRAERLDDFLWAFSNLACWGANNNDKRTYRIVVHMERLIEDEGAPSSVRHGLLVCLSTVVSRFSSKPSHEWAQFALDRFSKLSQGHQNLQLLMESCPINVEINNEKTDLILSEIGEMEYDITDKVALLRSLDYLSGMMLPFVEKCLRCGQHMVALNVLREWYKVAFFQKTAEENILIIYPNGEESLLYSLEKSSTAIIRNIDQIFPRMVSTANEFLGLSSSVGRVPEFTIHQPGKGRFGVPSEEKSDDFEGVLTEFYALNEISEFFSSHKSTISAMVPLPSAQHPIQYLLQKYIGCCWAISSSLLPPADDPIVKRVCLWCGAGSITEELELNAVRAVLESQGILVDYYSSEKSTKAEFIKVYESEGYDIIWVMSHGEFDHWQPGKVSMEIGDGDLSLNEMLDLKVPTTDSRRLLFLNVCDGATYVNQGGIPKIGLASAVAGNSQCTISHLWPINPFAAAAFGCLYASFIAQGLGFFDAFRSTLSVLSGTNNNVLSEIGALSLNDGELVRLLQSNRVSFNLMAHSGSAVFFQ